MNRGIVCLFILSLGFMLFFPAAGLAQVQTHQGIMFATKEGSGFSNSDLVNKRYWFRGLEFSDFETVDREACVTSGQVYFDTNTTFQASITLFCSDGSPPVSASDDGTYSVAGDGSFTFTTEGGSGPTLQGKISSDGSFVTLYRADNLSGDVRQMVILAVERNPGQSFSRADLDGYYNMNLAGISGFETSGREASLVDISFHCDGSGNWSASYTVFNSSGYAENGWAAGVYTVDTDGRFEFVEGSETLFEGYIDKDKEKLIISQAAGFNPNDVEQGIAMAHKVDPARSYATADLKGTYSFRMIQLHDIESVSPEAELITGSVELDGNGTWVTSNVVSYLSDNSTGSPPAMPAGIYTVNPDGTVILIPTHQGPTSEIWRGSYSADMQSLVFSSVNRPGAGARPAINLDGWGAVTFTTRDGASLENNLSVEVMVVDHDGIAADGSSHQVMVTFPDEVTTYLFPPPYRVSGSTAYYDLYFNSSDLPGNQVQSGEYWLMVVDQEGNAAGLGDDLNVDPLNPPDETSFSPSDGTVLANTSPIFTWNPVTFVNSPPGRSPNRYRVRIYSEDLSQTIWRGNLGNATTYQVPPDILAPNTTYRYRIEARDAHFGFEVDNNAKAPASNSDNLRFTTGAESEDPFVDLDNTGVETWNDSQRGPGLDFWVYVHDAQGVPGNIQSVTVTFPAGGRVEQLYYDAGRGSSTPTRGVYRRYLSETPQSGTYTFTVEDKDGNTYSITDDLNVNPIGFPAESSLRPANGTLIGSTAVNFDWEDVPGAAFYQLIIHDADFNRIMDFKTTDSHYSLAAGYLEDQRQYRYRILTRREFWDENVDNTSTSAWSYAAMPVFTTTPLAGGSSPPSIDSDGRGVSVDTAPLSSSGSAKYALVFDAVVGDADGVPDNIQSVTVEYPDGTIQHLGYDTYQSDTSALYRKYFVFDAPGDILAGDYTFTVRDFDGSSVQLTDNLPGPVADLVLSVPANLTPAQWEVLTTLTPTIDWDDVPNAQRYRVRIFDDFNETLHWSGYLTDSGYGVPGGVLSPGSTYSYKVYAYREAVPGVEVDYYSSNAFFHADAVHFQIPASLLVVSVPSSAAEDAGVLPGQGSVTILEPMATDLTVTLSSSDTSEVTVPDQVVIPSGSLSATFDVTIVDDVLLDGLQSATITATFGALGSATATIAVVDDDDTDGDGMDDQWERDNFDNSLDRDGTGDYDDDQLTDLIEYQIGTNPTTPFSDGDLMPDGWEALYGLNPNDPSDADDDLDTDGLTNEEEYQIGSNPANARPDQPALISPSNGAVDQPLSGLQLETDPYADPELDPHILTEWQISTSGGIDFEDARIYQSETDLALEQLAVPQTLLLGGGTYYWRVRFTDAENNPSLWSQEWNFTMEAMADGDANGIPDPIDLPADDPADLNENDTPDVDEPASSSWKCFKAAVGGGEIAIEVPSAPPPGCVINAVEAIDPATIADNVNRPSDLPWGLVGVSVTVPSAGDTIDITVTLSGPKPANPEWYVWSAVGGWEVFPATISETNGGNTQVVLTKTDGGAGDADGLANGIIVDPGGLAAMAAQQPPPPPGDGGGGCFISTAAE